MEPNPDLPFVVTLDDADDPADVIDALALGRFVAGIEPAARSLRLNRVRADAPLLPSTRQDTGRPVSRWSARAVCPTSPTV